MIESNRQLDLAKICVDLHIQPNLKNERACALAHTLVEDIAPNVDPTVYHVPLTAGSTEKCRVILHEQMSGRVDEEASRRVDEWTSGRVSARKYQKSFLSFTRSPVHSLTRPLVLSPTLTACSCADWQVHHRVLFGLNPMSSAWICPHGAAVLLSLGRSDTYLDFVSLPKVPVAPMAEASQTVGMDHGLDRRRFFAAFGKKHLSQWGRLGIDLEMVKRAYRLRFGVLSLSKLKQSQWVIAGAEMQSATQSKEIMINRAAGIKATLLGAKETA